MTNEAAVAALQQNLDKARELFAKRLLPAKLNVDGDEGSKNGRVLKAWLVGKDLQALSAQDIANALYDAVVADVQSERPQLVWLTPPKALVKRLETNKPATRGDIRESNAFEKKAHEGDAALEAQKLQDAAKKRVIGLVEGFTPTRRGILKYSLRDSKQAEWRKRIAEAKDFTKLESEIRDEQRKLYESLERPEQV